MFSTVGGQLAQYLERHSTPATACAAGSTRPSRRCSRSTPMAACCSPTGTRVRSSGAPRTSWSAPTGRTRSGARARDRARGARRGAAPSTRRRRPAREVAARAARPRATAWSARGRPARCARRRPRTRSRRGCGGRSAGTSCGSTTSRSSACAPASWSALEALLRWEDPVHGMISPAEFIPVAEQSGLIDALGDWVLEAVCAQQVEWAARGLRAAHLLQRVADAAAPRRLPRPRARRTRRERGRRRAADRRAHRVLDARGPGAGRGAGARARRARAADRARRLRHRLLVAVAAARAAGHDAEDRPRVPARACPSARRRPRS